MIGHRGDYKDGKWALVDEAGHPLTEYKYWHVEPWGEGYFKAMVTGSKYDLLTPEGEEIFHTPLHFIGRTVQHKLTKSLHPRLFQKIGHAPTIDHRLAAIGTNLQF